MAKLFECEECGNTDTTRMYVERHETRTYKIDPLGNLVGEGELTDVVQSERFCEECCGEVIMTGGGEE